MDIKRRVEKDGNVRWRLPHGQLHREDGPAIEYANGDCVWFLHGNVHRNDGPAVEYTDGTREWWLNDTQHRNDGPAVEYTDGTREWWLNDNRYTFAEWLDLIGCTLEQRTLLLLKWS